MNIKKFMETSIVPLYKDLNFKYQRLSPEFRFFSSDDFVHVFYQIKPIYKRLKPAFWEVSSIISIELSNGRYTFRPDTFKDISAKHCEYTCSNDDDLETAVHQLTKLILEKILPRLFGLRTAIVTDTPSYHILLAANTFQQARTFAETHQRELVYSKENCDWATQWISDMIPLEYSLRKDFFEDHIEDIVSFAAFCGELIRLHIEGTWKWIEDVDLSEKAYIIYSHGVNEDDGYNILHRVIDYWNFSKDLRGYNIFPLR